MMSRSVAGAMVGAIAGVILGAILILLLSGPGVYGIGQSFDSALLIGDHVILLIFCLIVGMATGFAIGIITEKDVSSH